MKNLTKILSIAILVTFIACKKETITPSKQSPNPTTNGTTGDTLAVGVELNVFFNDYMGNWRWDTVNGNLTIEHNNKVIFNKPYNVYPRSEFLEINVGAILKGDEFKFTYTKGYSSIGPGITIKDSTRLDNDEKHMNAVLFRYIPMNENNPYFIKDNYRGVIWDDSTTPLGQLTPRPLVHTVKF